jgi:hypothetical protein
MYSVVGVLMDCSMLCLHCASQDLTEPEIDYLKYGPDNYDGTMDKWPIRNEDGEYERNAKGNIRFKKNVKVTQVEHKGKQVYPIIDDGSDDGYGYCCDDCSRYFVEPYSLTCWECKGFVADSEEAIQIDRDFRPEEIFCKDCIEKMHKTMLSNTAEIMEVDLARLLKSKNPILTILGKITGLDNCFYPRLTFLTKTIERLKEATNVFSFKEEIENELADYAYRAWLGNPTEHVDILSTCLEVINGEIDLFSEDNDIEALIKLGDYLR